MLAARALASGDKLRLPVFAVALAQQLLPAPQQAAVFAATVMCILEQDRHVQAVSEQSHALRLPARLWITELKVLGHEAVTPVVLRSCA